MTSHTTSTSTGGGSNPSAWPADTLDRFGAADEIDISTRRDDDNLRGFVPIWIVTVDNALCTCAPTADATAPGTDTPPRDRPARSGPPASRPTSPSPRSTCTSVTCSRRSATPIGPSTATARAFAEAGAAVTLADVRDDALRTAEHELADAGHRVLAVRCDVSDEQQVAAAVARTVETFGSLDLAYNNAGIQSPMTDAADETAETFDRVNGINLRGIWASMKHELAQMRSQGSGAIVNCSSLGGLVGLPGRAAYHASKHGVIGLTRSAALEYAPRGIRINAICPGTIETPMVTAMIDSGDLDRDEAAANQPIGRLGSAEEMAAAVLWLCSPGASFVVGVALPVDGGYTAR